mgnify:CR=1 FL=1
MDTPKEYTLIKQGPKGQPTLSITSNSVEEARKIALSKVDTSQIWKIYEGTEADIFSAGTRGNIRRDLFRAYVIEAPKYRRERNPYGEGATIHEYTQCVTFNHTNAVPGWFDTQEEAKHDFIKHKKEAEKKINTIRDRLDALEEELAFNLELYAEHVEGYGCGGSGVFICAKQGGYTFPAELDTADN